ncbi:MAG: hypothetical protein J5496_02600 [Lachnospiraceae bacterium]|nr:hypothetical protein [Lachnospiraceae bacterium]
MKKTVTLVLIASMVFMLLGTGCGTQTGETGSSSQNAATATKTAGTKPGTTETEEISWIENNDPVIADLVGRYFEASRTGDEEALRDTLVSEADIDVVFLIILSRIYEEFRNIRIYSCPGMNADETCLFVLSDVKFVNIDQPATKSFVMYARPDKVTQQIRLMTETELLADKQSAGTAECAYTWYADKFAASRNINEIYKNASKAYEDALAQDSRLAHYVAQFEKGNYEIPTAEESTSPDEETTSETDQTPSEETTSPTEPTDPVSTVSGETLLPTPKTGFVSSNNVRVRSTPNTESTANVLMMLDFAHAVRIVGETDEWYHIVDNLTENGAGGTQSCSEQEGYIFKEFVVDSYSQLAQ